MNFHFGKKFPKYDLAMGNLTGWEGLPTSPWVHIHRQAGILPKDSVFSKSDLRNMCLRRTQSQISWLNICRGRLANKFPGYLSNFRDGCPRASVLGGVNTSSMAFSSWKLDSLSLWVFFLQYRLESSHLCSWIWKIKIQVRDFSLCCQWGV